MKLGAPLEIHELVIPKLELGQVLIKIHYSGICRSQLMEWNGSRGKDKWLPHLLGHEGFGTVVEIGPGVTKVKVGDEVIISWIIGEGASSRNPTFTSTRGLKINSGASTTFNEYSVVSENRVFKAPNGFKKEFLPLFGCALLTGGGMALSLLDTENQKNKKRALVLGFGGVGTSAALVLRGYPNVTLTIVEESSERRELAKQLGFKDVISQSDLLRNDHLKFDYCFESAGTTDSIEIGFRSVHDSGTLIFASHPKSGDVIKLDPYDLIKGKNIKGTWGGGLPPETLIEAIGERLLSYGENLSALVGPKFNLEDIGAALAYLADGKPGKPIIDFGGGEG